MVPGVEMIYTQECLSRFVQTLRFTKNLENRWKNKVPSLQSWQRATATQGASQPAMRNWAGILLNPSPVSHRISVCQRLASLRDTPAKKKSQQAFYRGFLGNVIASHLI